MSVGVLQAFLFVEEPSKVHYGGEDLIVGTVVLTFNPKSKAEVKDLFGPLKLAIVLHGRAKTKVWKSSGANGQRHLYRGRVPLFSRTNTICEDSFKAVPGQRYTFPFATAFPTTREFEPTDSWSADSDFASSKTLPPSFSNKYRGFANHYEAFVEYRLGVELEMRGIKVEILKPEKEREPLILYEGPRLKQALAARSVIRTGTVASKSELYLLEENRPSGFLSKAKAALTPGATPVFAFTWECAMSPNLYCQQSINIRVRIRSLENESTAVVIPTVRLVNVIVNINEHTKARAERLLVGHAEAHSDEPIARLACTVDNNDPFSKANDWTKEVRTTPLQGTAVSSSFSCPNISRRHQVAVSMTFRVGDDTKTGTFQQDVTIHPPIQAADDVASSAGLAGPSSAPPQYESPPEYRHGTT